MATEAQPKNWTYDDLAMLPADKRYEIIGGQLYEMPAANLAHARIIMQLLLNVFGPFLSALGGRLYTAPVDLFLRGASPVQPDILLLLPAQLGFQTQRGVEGPPALIVEVLSPSNPEHDRIVKRGLYAHAGVAEYWIVSPEAAIIEILVLDGTAYRTLARVAGDEPLVSRVLPDLALPASLVFSE
jgi:Uma2 family endonuclease